MYINRIIENLFIAVTGFTSLDFDIECYGTIIFQFDLNTRKDVYYLDCNLLEEKDYEKLLPYAFASIYRNNLGVTLSSTFLSNTKPIIDLYSSYNTESYQILQKSFPYLHPDYILNKSDKSSLKITDYLEIPRTFNYRSPIDMVNLYVNLKGDKNDNSEFKIYNAKRRMYYSALESADKGRQQIYISVQSAINESTKITLTSDQIMTVIIGEATFSLCREESYLLAPTIMHVVRTLQLKSSDCENSPSGKTACVLKYQTTFPDCPGPTFSPLFAYCNIGKYGYFLSILEQIGYMWRFYNQYCKNDQNNCKKKLIKYGDRFSNGVIASIAYTKPEIFKNKNALKLLNIEPLPKVGLGTTGKQNGGKSKRKNTRKPKRKLRLRKTRHLKSSHI
jgi:hypothetical protein